MKPADNHPFAALPKVELHRHLEGSLRLETMRELVQTQAVPLTGPLDLSARVQIQPDEEFNYLTFLSKFQTLRQFFLSHDVIQRMAYEAVADAALDRVRYMELRFTPVALSRVQGFGLAEVMDWVIESVDRASREFNITTRLIASVNRHEAPALAEEVARLAAERRECGIVALDLAGNEADFTAEPFIDIFKQARTCGLALTVHAGEWGSAQNVREALEVLDADRVAHGVRVVEDPEVVAIARERQTPFEVCLTSNYQSGVIPSLQSHPLMKMLAADLVVTLNTDDPSISQIRLSDEYRIACQELGLPRAGLKECILAGARASFLPDAEKTALIAELRQELDKFGD